jgi:hypothetical protein
MSASPSVSSRDESKAKNMRLALILASVAAVFFIGFMAKAVLLSHH